MAVEILNTEITTVALLILLIASFVIAFKIMKMVIETVTASAITGIFYLSLAYLFGFPITVERTLLFAFIGATLYMTYSFLISAYSIAEKILGVPYHAAMKLFKGLLSVFRRIKRYLRKKRKLKELQGETSGENVKQVVIDKVKKEEKED